MPGSSRARGRRGARWLEAGNGETFIGFDQRGGGNREDTASLDGGPPATDPRTISRQLLDAYDIEYVVCSGGMYSIGTIPDADYAAALCRADNDWQIQHWLPRDPRYLGVISIAPQDPAQAAAEIERVGAHPRMVEVMMTSASEIPLGRRYYHPIYAAAEAYGMLDEGAAIVDIGGESTRPGAEAVSLDEELRRVEPVLQALRGEPVSIDTSKAAVARVALGCGAVMVNDVTALRGDPELAGVVADAEAYLCLMHMLGEPRTMQEDPRYEDVVSEVVSFLEERLAAAVSAGISEERICLDPGIGFGKSVEHNLELLARLDEIVALGRPVLVGASRKRFLGRVLGDQDALTGPVSAGVAVAVMAYERGASLFRVHDVRAHVEALTAARAVVEAP